MKTAAAPVHQQKCTVEYKHKTHNALVVEQRFDKVKLNIFDDQGNVIHTNWYENKQIRRIW